MAEKSIEEKARRFSQEKIKNGKEFEQMQKAQNQLLEIQAAQKQNLLEQQIVEENYATQNQLLAQAAEVGAMSIGGANSMQLNPATQNTLGKYGLSSPQTTSVTKRSQVIRQRDIEIFNETANITNNQVPANIGGPIQGRGIQFKNPANSDGMGGMSKFKNWMSQIFQRQNEETRKRNVEYSKRETSLTKSSNRILRKLDDFSRDIVKKLDPRNLGQTVTGQLKTILALFGIASIAKNTGKILDGIKTISDGAAEFTGWIKGNGQTPKVVQNIQEWIGKLIYGKNYTPSSSDTSGGLLSGLKTVFWNSDNSGEPGIINKFLKKIKEELKDRAGLVQSTVKIPGELDAGKIARYIVDALGIFFGGREAAANTISKNVERTEAGRNNYHYNDKGWNDVVTGQEAFEKAGVKISTSNYGAGATGSVISSKSSAGVLAITTGGNNRTREGMYSLAGSSSRGAVTSEFRPLTHVVHKGALTQGGTRLATGADGKITNLASISQSNEIAELLFQAKQYDCVQPMSLIAALTRMDKTITETKTGKIVLDIWALENICKYTIGLDKLEEYKRNNKVIFKDLMIISRPCTLQELGGMRQGYMDEALENILTNILANRLGVYKLQGSILGLGTSALTMLIPGVGFVASMAIGWGSDMIFSKATDPQIVAAVNIYLASARQKGIALYTMDVIENSPEELQKAKLVYGEETTNLDDNGESFGTQRLAIMDKSVWEEIVKKITGDTSGNIGYDAANSTDVANTDQYLKTLTSTSAQDKGKFNKHSESISDYLMSVESFSDYNQKHPVANPIGTAPALPQGGTTTPNNSPITSAPLTTAGDGVIATNTSSDIPTPGAGEAVIATANSTGPAGKLDLPTFVGYMKPVIEGALQRKGIDPKFSTVLLANTSIETGNKVAGSVMYDVAHNFSGVHGINQSAIAGAGFEYYDSSFDANDMSNNYQTGTIVRGAGAGGRDAIFVAHKKRRSWPSHPSSSWWTVFKDENDWADYYVNLLADKTKYDAFSVPYDQDNGQHVIEAMFLGKSPWGRLYGTAEHYPETCRTRANEIAQLLGTGAVITTPFPTAGNIQYGTYKISGGSSRLGSLGSFAKEMLSNIWKESKKYVTTAENGVVKEVIGTGNWINGVEGRTARTNLDRKIVSNATRNVINKYSGSVSGFTVGTPMAGIFDATTDNTTRRILSTLFDENGNLIIDKRGVNPVLLDELNKIEVELKKGNAADMNKIQLTAAGIDEQINNTTISTTATIRAVRSLTYGRSSSTSSDDSQPLE